MNLLLCAIVTLSLHACASKKTAAVKEKNDVVISAFSSNAQNKKIAQENKEKNEKENQKLEQKTLDQSVLQKDSPTYVIQKYTTELQTIHQENQGKISANDEKNIAKKVRQFFDFQALAQYSLGDHWNKISEKDREEFSQLFIQLVESSYLQRSKNLVSDYKLEYKDEKIKGNEADVAISVARNDADIEIIYKLHKRSRDWMIYNIVLDNVDLIKNYQNQFSRVISSKGFDELLSVMKKKLKGDGIEVDVSL
ncbi:MAG: ABC transporter substrate-binding protein [Bdellovibrionales bacterium]|nr:ABC transporter substrate-binding protein [Bdellovibrionales bacterium]